MPWRQGRSIRPGTRCGLVLEGTTCNDLGKVPQPEQVCVAGAGVAVSFMDRSSIGNKQLFAKALELAQANEIPCQVKGSVSGGNDASAIQLAPGRRAHPGALGACRSIHSPSSVCKLSDVEAQLADQALLRLCDIVKGSTKPCMSFWKKYSSLMAPPAMRRR